MKCYFYANDGFSWNLLQLQQFFEHVIASIKHKRLDACYSFSCQQLNKVLLIDDWTDSMKKCLAQKHHMMQKEILAKNGDATQDNKMNEKANFSENSWQ